MDHSRNGNFDQGDEKGLRIGVSDYKAFGMDVLVDSGNGVDEEDRDACGLTDKGDVLDNENEALSAKRNNVESEVEDLGREETDVRRIYPYQFSFNCGF